LTAHTSTVARPAVFLDRDGVLNEVSMRDGTPIPPPSAAELRIIDGVPEACARLRDLGFVLVVVTNQPDIARGTQTTDEVDRMHASLRQRLALDDIVVCPHDDADECHCRKPKPGMFLDAARRLNLDLRLSIGVGDRWRDVEAARNAGVPAIYIQRGYGERPAVGAVATAASLLEALPFIENYRRGTAA
jgi:D-glycero-D-manno-heptose 1,7-bisphosphate phosphatase